MGPVTALGEQAPKGVLHGPGDGRKHVGLDRGELDDVLVEKVGRNLDAIWIDLVQHQHWGFGFVVDPLDLGLVQMNVAQAILVYNQLVLVVELAHVGIHHDGSVVGRAQIPVAILQQGANHALQLPWRGRTSRIPLLPRDVDLEQGLPVFGERRLIVCQFQ
jgi:hypothetical protein